MFAYVNEDSKQVTQLNTPTILGLTERIKIGNAFSIVDGKIKIGAGVKLIIINAQINFNWNTGPKGSHGTSILKNGNEVCRGYSINTNEFTTMGSVITEFPLEVAENDIIELGIMAPATGNVRIRNYDDHLESYITLRVIN